MVTNQKRGGLGDRQVDGTGFANTTGRTPLAELLAQCRPDNRPETVDFGTPVGGEVV